MHIHLPKPLHGWREVIGEVGIIVVGILIALGAEQAVETLHHRSQVHEMTEKLRAESIGNRDVLRFDRAILHAALTEIDTDIAALNDCASPASLDLRELARPRYLMPKNAAWMGLRDSALLPLMPDELADGYWILDVSQSFLRADAEQANAAFVDAAGAVEVIRRAQGANRACDEALISLERLKQADTALLNRTEYNAGLNDRMLAGKRLDGPRGMPQTPEATAGG